MYLSRSGKAKIRVVNEFLKDVEGFLFERN